MIIRILPYGYIKSALNDKCLSTTDGSIGANVQMQDCDKDDDKQKWYYDPATQEIKTKEGNCLDVEGDIQADGTNIRIWDCYKNTAQKWEFNLFDGVIKNDHFNDKGFNRCIDIKDINPNNGANIHLWGCHGQKNQIWYYAKLAEVSIEIRKENRYDWIWDDTDTGSDRDGAFWKPLLNPGESFVSFVNTDEAERKGYTEPTDITSIIITAAPYDALAKPTDYQLIWNDKGSNGKHDVWFLKPIPPNGYVCFGDFVSRTSIPSWANQYKCIHENYVDKITDDKVKQDEKWDDNGSGADLSTGVIQINVNGFPNQYFRMNKDTNDAKTINGPFYTFRQYADSCKIINIVADNDLSKQLLSGTADSSMSITYINGGVNSGTTEGFSQNKCKTSSSSFTHKSGSKLSITTTFGYKQGGGIKGKGITASGERNFELSITGELYKEYEETISHSQEICTNIPKQEVSCPGRSQCKRDYIVFTAPNTIIPVSVTVQCGTLTDIIKGEFTATGAASIYVVDTFTPLDCVYYTNNYDDRHKGKLPFCDTCSSSNKCDICRDGMVLTHGECYEDRICTEECKGSIQSPSQTVPHSTSPDFAGRYCVNEDITLQSCKTALRRT